MNDNHQAQSLVFKEKKSLNSLAKHQSMNLDQPYGKKLNLCTRTPREFVGEVGPRLRIEELSTICSQVE